MFVAVRAIDKANLTILLLQVIAQEVKIPTLTRMLLIGTPNQTSITQKDQIAAVIIKAQCPFVSLIVL